MITWKTKICCVRSGKKLWSFSQYEWYFWIVLPRSFCVSRKYSFYSGIVKIRMDSRTGQVDFLYAIDEKCGLCTAKNKPAVNRFFNRWYTKMKSCYCAVVYKCCHSGWRIVYLQPCRSQASRNCADKLWSCWSVPVECLRILHNPNQTQFNGWWADVN